MVLQNFEAYKNQMALQKHRARKKQIIEDLISSGDLELTGFTAEIALPMFVKML